MLCLVIIKKPNCITPCRMLYLICYNHYMIKNPSPKKTSSPKTLKSSSCYEHFLQRHSRLISILAPLFAGLLFVVLACLNLNGPIWHDEAYTSYLIRGDFSDIINLTAKDVHPPLFYLLLKIWSFIFGTSAIALRFMSVFFGCIALVFAFQLVKRWFGLKYALPAVFILILSPIFIRLGQEMRMYTLLFAIFFSATFFLTLALDTKKPLFWFIYGALVSLGVLTHYFSILIWLTHFIYLIYYYRGPRHFLAAKWPLFSYLFAILLFLPWLPSCLSQVSSVQQGYWIPPVSLYSPFIFLIDSLVFLDAGPVEKWFIPFLIIFLIAVLYFSPRALSSLPQKIRTKVKLLLFIALLPPLLLFFLSLPPFKPMFVNRYLSPSALTIWLLLALLAIFLIFKRPVRLLSFIFAPLFVIITVFGVYNVETRSPNSHISDTLTSVRQMTKSGEPILINSEWNFYDAVFYSTERHPIYFVDSWGDYPTGAFEPIKKYRHQLIDNFPEFAKNHSTLWYLTNTPAEEKDLKLPPELQTYTIKYKITNPHHTVVSLEKSQK